MTLQVRSIEHLKNWLKRDKSLANELNVKTAEALVALFASLGPRSVTSVVPNTALALQVLEFDTIFIESLPAPVSIPAPPRTVTVVGIPACATAPPVGDKENIKTYSGG